MSFEQLVAMARRNIEHVKAGTQDQEAGVFTVPASDYVDADRWQREVDAIFKRLPLVLGFSSELRDPGAYKAIEVVGVPVLISRGADGAARAFVNMCSHRGAIVVDEGVGTARRFACPYHGWTYDQHGDLVGIPDRTEFGDIDPACHGLTALPVAERAGLIFVGLTPGSGLDVDTFLGGYDELLAHLRFDDCHVVGHNVIEGPNWKVAYDGYLDFYHLPVLHRESFGPDMGTKALYDAWGPHQRVTMPNPSYLKLEDQPSAQWDETELIGGVWTIFPHVSVAGFDAGFHVWMVSQLFPGPTPDRSTTIQNFLVTEEPTDEMRAAAEGQAAFLEQVVRDEDYYTGLRIQRALATGARPHVMFGRNEGGGQRFHRWVAALLDAGDDELAEVFSTRVDAAG